MLRRFKNKNKNNLEPLKFKKYFKLKQSNKNITHKI